jgi:16S rRNA (cytosine1402-N4)-methyltransferase
MQETIMNYHVPVLLRDAVNGLNIKESGTYVDLTFGGGGHSCAVMERLGKSGKLYAFDQDFDAKTNAPHDKRFVFVHGNFRYLQNFMDYFKETSIDGVLADLGVSSHHLDDEQRGFSYRFDSQLDMRMNQKAEKTAQFVINSYSKDQLTTVLADYGEIHNAYKLADGIVKIRNVKQICSVRDLLMTVKPFVDPRHEKKYLSQVFQALRIEVNDELQALHEVLQQAMQLLVTGGRIVVITYHSLEDRLVKNFFKAGNQEGVIGQDLYGNKVAPLAVVNKKVITPNGIELQHNPRARSAKLRIAQKLMI